MEPIENSGDSYFYFTWAEPGIKNGEIRNYSITIQSYGPLYTVDEDCVVDTETYTFWQSPDETWYNFTEAKPYYNYSVIIAAATSIGYGGDSNIEFVQTQMAQPEPPIILDYQHEEYDLTDYDVKGIVNWKAPCEKNGELSHFRVIIEGTSTYDDEIENDTVEFLIDTNQFNFTFERSLKAAFNYTYRVASVLTETSLQSDNAEITFLAPDGCKSFALSIGLVQNYSSFFFNGSVLII